MPKPALKLPEMLLEEPEPIEPGIRRLAAAVFLNALQVEMSGRFENGNRPFLSGQGRFDHWARCLEYDPDLMKEKISKALKGDRPKMKIY